MRDAARQLRAEEGWTLVELMTVILVSGVVMAALLTLWTGAARREANNAVRFESLDDASRVMERITREVRGAVAVTGVTASAATIKLWTRDALGTAPSVLRTIAYDCAGAGTRAGTFACMRQDTTAGTAAVRVLDGLTSASVFQTTAGQPDLRLSFSMWVPRSAHPIVVQGGASPRNCSGALSSCTGP